MTCTLPERHLRGLQIDCCSICIIKGSMHVYCLLPMQMLGSWQSFEMSSTLCSFLTFQASSMISMKSDHENSMFRSKTASSTAKAALLVLRVTMVLLQPVAAKAFGCQCRERRACLSTCLPDGRRQEGCPKSPCTVFRC